MGIQERLKRQRYGEHCIFMPTNDDIKHLKVNRNMRYSLKKKNTNSLVLNSFINPPKKDKYFSGYYKLINDYARYQSNSDGKSLTYIVETILISKLAYFLENSKIYNNNFNQYSQSWLFGAMCSMRKYVMYKKMKAGEIPILYDLNNPASNGYYPIPKPMNNPAMIALGEHLYELLHPYARQLSLD